MDGVHDAQRLKELQALPLERKIMITQTRIMEWYQRYNGNVYVSFSGGKDSTVLLHIARKMFPDIPAVFSNTGLEYYEIQRFAFWSDNVTIIRPKMRFDEVVSTYGYPLIGKEVAEAIYYARRIRSQNSQVEREREQHRESEPSCRVAERMEETGTGGGEEPPHPDRNSAEQKDSLARPLERNGQAANRPSPDSIPTDHARRIRRREELHGTLHRNEQANRKSRGETDWSHWRRGCL